MKSIKTLSLILILIIIGITVFVLKSQDQARTLSAVITRSAPELGQGAHLLLPNLKSARVVAPDRPHDPSELQDPDSKAKIRRLRTFDVSTTDRGFRTTNPFEGQKARILTVGDSVTFGWGVAETESYPYRLAESLSVSIDNAGVPAMKPQHIALWMKKNKDNHAGVELILFARRIDWGQPKPWESYFQAIQDAMNASKPAKFALILPPISTFDPRGLAHQEEELSRLKKRFPQLAILDLTPSFRHNAPKEGIVLQINGQEQVLLDNASNTPILSAIAPPLQPGSPALAKEITDYFEAHPNASEPLFFDGGHPTAEGFKIFAEEVRAFIIKEGLFTP